MTHTDGQRYVGLVTLTFDLEMASPPEPVTLSRYYRRPFGIFKYTKTSKHRDWSKYQSVPTEKLMQRPSREGAMIIRG